MKAKDETAEYNRQAWDSQVKQGNKWTVPVDEASISRARAGDWSIVLTPTRPIPDAWFPNPLKGIRTLCLASGGGQQAPILAAAGADVTVVDNSPKQLEQDSKVASREGLEIKTKLCDMRHLEGLDDGSFDLIIHPCSNCFVPEIQSVWAECSRVLAPGGRLLCGMLSPIAFLFDESEYLSGRLKVRHPLPYTDETHLTRRELDKLRQDGEPVMFSHSLTEQVAGQVHAGLQLVDLYEDVDPSEPMSKYFPPYLATYSMKP